MITIDQIFKVVNFLATLFLFIFLFKKHLAPFFFEEKKRFDDGIKDKKKSRKLLQKQLDQLVVDQEEQVSEGKALEKKCKQWAQKMKKDREQKEEELRLARVKMVEHRQQQWVYIQNQRCLQQKLPMIFHDVDQYFETLPNKEKVSKKYCDTLITFMKD